jgi:hypothetical protein
MTDTPPTVDDDLVNELRAHLDQVPLVELAALVSVENVCSVSTRLSDKPRSGSRSVATTDPVTEPERWAATPHLTLTPHPPGGWHAYTPDQVKEARWPRSLRASRYPAVPKTFSRMR